MTSTIFEVINEVILIKSSYCFRKRNVPFLFECDFDLNKNYLDKAKKRIRINFIV